MIAQFILTLGLAAIAVIAIMQIRKAAFICTTILITTTFGIYLVWEPDDATIIARHVGIGRGTDLVLYLWILISFFSLLIVYLKIRGQFEAITSLTRALALAQAEHQFPPGQPRAPTLGKTSAGE